MITNYNLLPECDEVLDTTLVAESHHLGDYQFTSGFHGTDDLTAFQIVRSGFNRDYVNATCFSAPDDRELAVIHAEKNAQRNNRDRYALLKATFPITTLSQGALGGACLRFSGNELQNVSLVAMGIFSASDGEVLATYSPAALAKLRQR